MDSDDYFQGQLELDDDVLVLLDQEEAKFVASSRTQARRLTPPPTPPPAKRQKLSHAKEVVLPGDDEPEIRLRVGGRYDVGSVPSAFSRLELTKSLAVAEGDASPPVRSARIEKTTDPPASIAQTTLSVGLEHQTRTIPDERPPINHPPEFSRTQITAPLSTITSLSNNEDAQNSQSKRNLERKNSARSRNIELVLLQTEVEQLKRDQATLEEVLKAERSHRYTKEGEVTILRKSIEKVQKEHAAHVAQLQASRELAEAKQIETQRRMKEEMERLRTEFTFKKHEIENSAYRSNMTARVKRVNGAHINSPVPVPDAMKSWNPKATAFRTSPTRQQLSASQRRMSPLRTVSAMTAEPSFPGFENSFLQSSPTKSPTARKTRQRAGPPEATQAKRGINHLNDLSQRLNKGKQRAVDRELLLSSPTKNRPAVKFTQLIGPKPHRLDEDIDMEDGSSSPIKGRDAFMSSLVGEDAIDDFGDYSDFTAAQADAGDVINYDVLHTLDWRDELHLLLLTHTCSKSSAVTLQVLLSTTFPHEVPSEIVDLYHKGCASLLEAMGAKYNDDILEKVAFATARSLVSMARALLVAEQLTPLTHLLNMIYSLIIYIPSFLSSLMRTILTDGNNAPRDASPFMTLLCDVIATQMQPGQAGKCVEGRINEARLALGQSVLKILEVVCWFVGKDDVMLLSATARDDRIICGLLDRDQPGDYCISTLRILVMLATHAPLCQSLVEAKATGAPDKEDPLLNRLAKLLIDKRPMSPDVHEESSQLIIKVFGLLSIADPTGHAAVLGCRQAIPAMVLCLQAITSPIYEDDGQFVNYPERALPTIRRTRELVHLLHYLVFFKASSSSSPINFGSCHKHKRSDREPNLNLFNKLNNAPPIPYNGSVHIFVTSISRLSYAEPPEWLSEEGRTELEDVAELARELLELVVQGPDCDGVWDAFQGGGDEDDQAPFEQDAEVDHAEDVEMIDDLLENDE